MTEPILHITTPEAWERGRVAGELRPASLDAEGFIHCSTPRQVVATADRLFGGTGDLLLLVVDPARLTAPLRHEAATDVADTFPHIHGPLNADAIIGTAVLREGPGGYVLPDELA
jgi:uncharacterized protein (DUF952 family)